MQKTTINPWSWSLKFGFNQGQIVEGTHRQLICSGQTAVDAEGNPQHVDDMRAQMALALENLKTVLDAAGMSLADVVRLNVFTTDMDETLKHFDVLGAQFAVAPCMSLLGVTRLAVPVLMFEIEAMAYSQVAD